MSMLLRRRSLLLMSGSMGLSACRSLPSTPMVAEVIHYEATIEPVIARRTLTGRLVVSIVGGDGALRLDAGGLTIAAVTEAGEPRAFEKTGTSLQIELAARPGRRDVEIDFHGAPTSGLVFDSEADQVHTVFATSQWMPCLDAPGVRATLGLTLVLPAGLVSAATGDPMPPRTLPDGRISTRWRLERPMPSYLYGFAAGRFVETTERAGPVTLRSLATPAFTAEQLVRIVKDTPDMIGFFERRSGVPYPDSRYTQVVLKGRAAQEMSGVSLVGERYGRAVLADETDLWLGAHELAHTWWGNGVTNRAWTHFWLNEGIATFMTAAYLEHRAGRAAYDTLIDASRRKYEALATAGRDHALVFDRWDRPSADDRSIVYDKGAYVVHRLRDELGEDAFWRGLAAYTRANWGRSVMTEDFRRAMQVAAGRDLGPFFERWVFA